MIHLITGDNAPLFKSQLDEMFRLRFRYFVEGRGWDLPVENGRERDQFDRDDTVYLAKFAPAGDMMGSFRMLPTERAHLMSEVLPPELGIEWPRGQNVWEISRGFILEQHRSFDTLAEFCVGMVEFSLLWGIDRFVFLIEPSFLSTILAMGWDARPLSAPMEIAGEPWLAAELRIVPETLKIIRQVTGLHRPVIAYNRAFAHAA